METAQLKSFATWARKALIDEVNARVKVVLAPGSPERVERPGVVSALERAVGAAGGGETGRAAVADRVAYTWFNRVIALRFMDANGYTGIGVVSPQAGIEGGQPEILAEVKRGNIDAAIVGTKTSETVTGLLNGTRRSDDPQGEAYALLLAEYCRHWNRTMPFMFEREGDFTELLIPANLLADDSILNRAVKVLTTDVCRDVEVIGWLYQFYISERHDEVFAGFKKNKKAGAAEIPAATQLFTPHWIVRYLIENSLGRLWMLNRPSSSLVDQMEYYIAPVDEETDFLQLAGPEELTIIDPACGSGHMLTYAFDILYAIYEEEGYAPSDIPGLILSNNLHGTEIDPRAGSLAAFALTMKARARQRTFFNRRAEPNICVLEPVTFTPQEVELLVTATGNRYAEVAFWNQFRHADTFGSLICPDASVLATLRAHIETIDVETDLIAADTVSRAQRVIRQSEALSSRHSAVVTNPPYMSSANMSSQLAEWVARTYPVERQDLYSCFAKKGLMLTAEGGILALITGDSWIALKSFAQFREKLLNCVRFSSFVHLDDVSKHADIFGANTAFACSKNKPSSSMCFCVELEPLNSDAKVRRLIDAIAHKGAPWVFHVHPANFNRIPGSPFAYRLSNADIGVFSTGITLGEIVSLREGINTGDNDRFLRRWWEVSFDRVSFDTRPGAVPLTKWVPHKKGGPYRKWAGNQEYVLNWANGGSEIRKFPRSTPRNIQHFFFESASWGRISSGDFSMRLYSEGYSFDSTGPCAFGENTDIAFAIAYLNSDAAKRFLGALSPTLDYRLGNLGNMPAPQDRRRFDSSHIARLVRLSQKDWDLSELAWGFEANPLVGQGVGRVSESFSSTLVEWQNLVSEVAQLEDENEFRVRLAFSIPDPIRPRDLSRVALNANPAFRFGPGIDFHDLRVQRSVVVELLSFAVGCMLGRYSIDVPGLILGNQSATMQDYLAKIPVPTFMPDPDNVIPVVDGDWFEDDIVARFRQFLRAAFGEEHFEENLRFVTESLGVKDLRDYFVNSFYRDHIQRYKKRPIYWLFSSPKGSFNALIYMHRYAPSTVGTVLNEYLREYQAKLKSSLEHHERLPAGGGTPREVAAAQREADRLRRVLVELDEYERDLYLLASQPISIDLDDGVKVNYPKFGAALKKIPGLEASDE
jgi:hypothetical protein